MTNSDSNKHKTNCDTILAAHRLMESINSQQDMIQRATRILGGPSLSATQKMIESINSQQDMIQRATRILGGLSSIDSFLFDFATASSEIFKDSSVISDIVHSIDNAKISSMQLDNMEADLSSVAENFRNAGSQESIVTIFNNLSPAIQAVIVCVFLNIILPILTSVAANFITPVVQDYLVDNSMTDKEKVKDIKEIPLYFDGLTTEGTRFITVNSLHLRSEPSTKSEVLDILHLGQVVTVLSKEKNWIEVTYKTSEGDLITGWVFTRYTAKFVR